MLSFLNTNNMLENYAYNSILDELNKNNISPLMSLLSIVYWLKLIIHLLIFELICIKVSTLSFRRTRNVPYQKTQNNELFFIILSAGKNYF